MAITGDTLAAYRAAGAAARNADTRVVAAVAAQQFSIYELDEEYRPVGIDTDFALGIGERFQIFGLNDTWMEDVFAGQLSKESPSLSYEYWYKRY